MKIKMQSGGFAGENQIGEYRVAQNATLDPALTNRFTSLRVVYDIVLSDFEGRHFDEPATLTGLLDIVLTQIPPAVFGRAVSAWSVPERVNRQLYRIEITYSSEVTTDIWDVEFVANSETVHIIKDRETISSYGAYIGGTQIEPVDLDGLIAVQDGNVTGADIISAVATYSMTTSLPRYVVSDAQMQNIAVMIANAVGKTNQNLFRGFDAETLLMVGGSGITRTGDTYEVRLNFDFRPNEELELQSGGETIQINKKGHQLLSILTRTMEKTNASLEEDKFVVSEPISFYVHRVYPMLGFQAIVTSIENLWI